MRALLFAVALSYAQEEEKQAGVEQQQVESSEALNGTLDEALNTTLDPISSIHVERLLLPDNCRQGARLGDQIALNFTVRRFSWRKPEPVCDHMDLSVSAGPHAFTTLAWFV